MIKVLFARLGSSNDPILLSLLGLIFLVIAAFLWSPIAGFAAAGVACILFELRVDASIKERRNAGR